MDLINKGCFNCEHTLSNFRQTKCLRWKSGIYKVLIINGFERLVRDCYSNSSVTVSIPNKKIFTEKIFDQHGNLIFAQTYPFSRLFKPGQEQVINSIPMTIISCTLEDNIIITMVHIGDRYVRQPF